MKKKKWVIAIVIFALMLGAGVGIWYFLEKRNSLNGEESIREPEFAEVLEDYASSLNDPLLKASTTLGIAGEAMTQKDYDKAISFSQRVLDQSDAPNEMKQVARRNIMYAYSLKGNNSEALKYAKEYKQNLPSDDPELKAKEDAFIDQQIVQLENNQPLTTVGGAEEGD
jgi:tetratricopeptide (TPR) repeat protein